MRGKNFSDQNWKLVSGNKADNQTRSDLEFAWRAVRSVKSNAILLARDGASVGIGMGQVNRLDSCELAVTRAGSRVKIPPMSLLRSVLLAGAEVPGHDQLRIALDSGIGPRVANPVAVADELLHPDLSRSWNG